MGTPLEFGMRGWGLLKGRLRVATSSDEGPQSFI